MTSERPFPPGSTILRTYSAAIDKIGVPSFDKDNKCETIVVDIEMVVEVVMVVMVEEEEEEEDEDRSSRTLGVSARNPSILLSQDVCMEATHVRAR
jgi:hypothetical protein